MTTNQPLLKLSGSAGIVRLNAPDDVYIQARYVPRGEHIGFDREPNNREDRVVLTFVDYGKEELLGINSAQTMSRISGGVPFKICSDPTGKFTIPKEQADTLSGWARSNLARLTAERGETITHGSVRKISPNQMRTP